MCFTDLGGGWFFLGDTVHGIARWSSCLPSVHPMMADGPPHTYFQTFDHHTHILTTIHTFPNTLGVRGRKEVRTTSGAYSFSGPPEKLLILAWAKRKTTLFNFFTLWHLRLNWRCEFLKGTNSDFFISFPQGRPGQYRQYSLGKFWRGVPKQYPTLLSMFHSSPWKRKGKQNQKEQQKWKPLTDRLFSARTENPWM